MGMKNRTSTIRTAGSILQLVGSLMKLAFNLLSQEDFRRYAAYHHRQFMAAREERKRQEKRRKLIEEGTDLRARWRKWWFF